MTNRVAIYSQNAEFCRASQHYLELQGLRVVLRDAWRGQFSRPLRAHTVFIDCPDFEEEALRSFLVQCRMRGARPVLCGHWSKSVVVEDMAKALKVSSFTYPVHPRETLRFMTQNQFAAHPSKDQELQLLADIAGLLYKIEGVVPGDWEGFEGFIQQRMAEVMVGTLEAYGALIISEREELSLLAEVVEPKAVSLFRPYSLFATLRESLLPALKRSARLYSLAPEDGHEALALAVLCAADKHSEKKVFSKNGQGAWGRPLRLEDLAYTPFEFRDLLCPWLVWGESKNEGRLSDQLLSYLSEDTGALGDLGPFEMVICRRLDELYERDDLAGAIRELTRCLVESGLLLLAPGESILMSDLSLKAQQLGPLTVYTRVPESEKGVLQ